MKNCISNSQDYKIFHNVDLKSKYLVIREMSKLLQKHVEILQSKTPKDTAFRRFIIGAPFWAEGQSYKYRPSGAHTDVLLEFTITRGGFQDIRDISN